MTATNAVLQTLPAYQRSYYASLTADECVRSAESVRRMAAPRDCILARSASEQDRVSAEAEERARLFERLAAAKRADFGAATVATEQRVYVLA
jgi:hypothetical protein